MAESPAFGDHVRIVSTGAMIESGRAGREGTVYGWTTPSWSGVEVVGQTEDYAVNVRFEEPVLDGWFDASLVEIIDHAPGSTITVGDQNFVRNAEGNWTPVVLMEVCPGCGYILEKPAWAYRGARADHTFEWRRLPDGRYLGVLAFRDKTIQVLHDCPYGGGGGDAHDRSPRPLEPPPHVLSVELVPPESD